MKKTNQVTSVIQAACSVKRDSYQLYLAVRHGRKIASELFVGCPVPFSPNREADCVWFLLYIYIMYNIRMYMDVSKNRGTPKWMVYNGKPYENGWFGGAPIFGNTHTIYIYYLYLICVTFWKCWKFEIEINDEPTAGISRPPGCFSGAIIYIVRLLGFTSLLVAST